MNHPENNRKPKDDVYFLTFPLLSLHTTTPTKTTTSKKRRRSWRSDEYRHHDENHICKDQIRRRPRPDQPRQSGLALFCVTVPLVFYGCSFLCSLFRRLHMVLLDQNLSHDILQNLFTLLRNWTSMIRLKKMNMGQKERKTKERQESYLRQLICYLLCCLVRICHEHEKEQKLPMKIVKSIIQDCRHCTLF